MRYFPAPLTKTQSDRLAARAQATIVREGWGLWAVEVLDTGGFIGFVGLNQPPFQAHFTPAVEVGWRLARGAWGQGYATEAARASLTFGFDHLDCDEIVSFTAAVNDRSRRVMSRLGMSHDPYDDFDHPSLPAGPLQRHVLYRMSRESWRNEPSASQ